MTGSGAPTPEPRGSIRPLGPGPLTLFLVVGLVCGWGLRRLPGLTPLVTWQQVVVLWFAAAVLAVVAWHTWRTVRDRRPLLEAHEGVNRLLLARACALVGALVAGGYAGHALSWLGSASPLVGERIGRSALASLAGVVIVVVALLLERTCRVDGGDAPDDSAEPSPG
ncbi:DUF3180 domain-containing protein [Nocardioides limicola]|uniref:DUF3180 domain-containing protein n=1 Tax=Nocardioides limicola TaxID=2803368 RepID=UPI0027DCBE14|nr:DUF3180 domain-containing protein [Nocardioides sp. DJM-14]